MTNRVKWLKVMEFTCSQPQAKHLNREQIVELVYKAMMNQFPEEKASWDECKRVSLMATK